MATNEKRKNAIVHAAMLVIIHKQGIMSLNSTEVDRILGRLANNPEFTRLGITLREIKKVYAELCKDLLDSRAEFSNRKNL